MRCARGKKGKGLREYKKKEALGGEKEGKNRGIRRGAKYKRLLLLLLHDSRIESKLQC